MTDSQTSLEQRVIALAHAHSSDGTYILVSPPKTAQEMCEYTLAHLQAHHADSIPTGLTAAGIWNAPSSLGNRRDHGSLLTMMTLYREALAHETIMAGTQPEGY